MEDFNDELNVSDDEIIFGNELLIGNKLNLKAIRKILGIRHVPVSTTGRYVSPKPEPDTSLRLIKTHSQPNLRSNTNESPASSETGSLAYRQSEDSFVQMENMVTKLCLSSRNSEDGELNNTLDVIDFILKNGPNLKQEVKIVDSEEVGSPLKESHKLEDNKSIEEYVGPNLKQEVKIIDSEEVGSPLKESHKLEDNKSIEEYVGPNLKQEVKIVDSEEVGSPLKESHKLEDNKSMKEYVDSNKDSPLKFNPKQNMPDKDYHNLPEKAKLKGSSSYFTPVKSVQNKPIAVVTPSSSSSKLGTPAFKTPANPTAKKKMHTPKHTPGRTNIYQHITSPIASYIKNCPQIPLVKDVRPKKPLPGPSGIPKLVRKPSQEKIQNNKENINLPSIAYKSAKKTQVVQLPDVDKLPQCRWVKQIASSNPRPTVMAHKKREMNPIKKLLPSNQEDSFANLSCNQAEVSVCTQKTAFKSTKKH